MNQARMGLLVAAALMAVPAFAHAQKGKKPASAAETGGDAKGGAKGGDAKDGAAGTTEAAAGEQGKKEEAKPGSEGGGGDAGDVGGICQIDPSACPKNDVDITAEIPKQIYAVQQIYALRKRRFEVNPYWSFTLNDQFVSHPGPGLALNYYITNVIAVGGNFNWYRGLNQDSEFNAQTRRAARVGVPLTEFDWSGALNVTYVPMYGKFAGFGDFIFHYDAYLVAGGGVLSNRPIAVIDPDNRTFENSNIHPTANVGLGLRIFFNRWFSAILEVRDYVFFDKIENTAPLSNDPNVAKNPNTWLEDGTRLTNHVQAQIGVSLFLPFSWKYELPK